MAKKLSAVPKGFHTVTPELVVRNVEQALSYYQDVFEATEISRALDSEGNMPVMAEMKIGNSIVRLVEEMPHLGVFSPVGFGGTAVGIHIYHAKADGIWERAQAHGAGIVVPFAQMPWGERYGRMIDPFGHVWSISRKAAVEMVTEVTEPEQVSVDASGSNVFSVHEPLADRTEPTFDQAVDTFSSQDAEKIVA